jgi:hypothetical protein
MKVVYKYSVASGASIEFPQDAKVIHVANFMIWVEFDPRAAKDTLFNFKIYGTGHPIPKDACHVQTFFEGAFVWHLYLTKEMR